MNNRYLFRAKRTDNGGWAEGTLLHKSSSFSVECDEYYIFDGIETSSNDDLYLVDPSTICQCTGKHDIPKNKMIYEHDFVSFLDTYSTESGYAEQYCVGEVLWDDEELCFYVTNRLSAESYEVLDDCKVIGNRFDNPELFEVGE